MMLHCMYLENKRFFELTIHDRVMNVRLFLGLLAWWPTTAAGRTLNLNI
jgi:hypothetical protein